MLEKTMSPFQNKLKKEGGLIVYPTETAYALGCDATNEKAVDAVFKIKGREKTKTLPLIAASLAMVKKYCKMSAAEEQLARRYWPGQLTLILNIKYSILNIKYFARGVVAKDKTIAIRVSSNKIARELSRRLGRPIVATSANMAGKGECYSVEEVKKQVGANDYSPLQTVATHGKIPVQIIDVGRLPKRKPSTVVRIEKNGRMRVLRQGEILSVPSLRRRG